GIVTGGDISRKTYAEKSDPYMVQVSEVMSEPLIWAKSDAPEEETLRIMDETGLKRLPLIGNLSSKPVLLGLLTRAEQLEEETVAPTS
ncbi:CBS domain-containing protein, partial [Candidatus Bathyarchaeota archaeon]|nr:CBS domain-containing protein [Candidatus Bathyarchaeota archaeon]